MQNACANCLFEFACEAFGSCPMHDKEIGFDPYLDLLPGVESLVSEFDDQPF